MSESVRRSIVKTISWRLTGSGATLLVAYFMTGSFKVAGTIASIQIVSNTFLYYAHERIWNGIKWGASNAGQELVCSKTD